LLYTVKIQIKRGLTKDEATGCIYNEDICNSYFEGGPKQNTDPFPVAMENRNEYESLS
jgi:hypothetical protein